MTKRFVICTIGVVAVILAGAVAFAATDSVAPQSLELTHLRGEGTLSGGATTMWRGDNMLLTNCIVYNSTNASGARQGLSNVTVRLLVGNTDSALAYTGTVQDVTAGVYYATVAVPTSGSVYVQATVIDENTNEYTYGWKTISVRNKID